MSKLLKIDNIMYFVKDLYKSAEFYEKELGLKRVWTDKENGQIGFQFPESDSEIVIHNDPDLPNPDFSFLVENVEEFIKDKKVCFGPIDVRCGKFAVISDPDENKIPIIDLTKFGGKPRYD